MSSKRKKNFSILLVDDEPDVVESLVKELDFRGYCAEVCTSTYELEETLSSHSHQIKIVVLDNIITPGEERSFIDDKARYSINAGREASISIQAKYPTIKIVVYSQIDQTEILNDFEKRGIPYVNKQWPNAQQKLIDIIIAICQGKELSINKKKHWLKKFINYVINLRKDKIVRRLVIGKLIAAFIIFLISSIWNDISWSNIKEEQIVPYEPPSLDSLLPADEAVN